ncbi:class I SAM-dependent methyltransferase [Roseovarius spongiae]|uniref:Class I SAM-dependent methyltransferase n=1 Tax=Roseovarius spongiae TaxID=2320272 RepID=A0A3A8AX02_9RHOB|nr:class I SAM-dependent methyltransferase [Roseovarius spongiae]RKF16307.1 class I SAM-dependent methyltransferase [Roseovarius spongiae]
MSDDNTDQAEYWTSGPGRKWVEQREALDATLAPVLDLMLERAAPAPGMRVLDVACGTGTSTLAIAERIAPGGRVLGVDISETLLEEARARGDAVTNAHFTRGDAQIHPFELAAHDVAVSRFGMMFFADPAQAFRNIASSLKPGAPLVFTAWRSVAENPWFAIPAKAARERLGDASPTPPRAPGPMAFEDETYVAELLQKAGLQDVEVARADVALTPPGTAVDVAALSTRIGPAASIIREKNGSAEDIAAIQKALRDALANFETPEGIRIPAAIQLCTARTAG